MPIDNAASPPARGPGSAPELPISVALLSDSVPLLCLLLTSTSKGRLRTPDSI